MITRWYNRWSIQLPGTPKKWLCCSFWRLGYLNEPPWFICWFSSVLWLILLKKTIKHLCIWLVDNLDMSVLTWSFTMCRGPGGLPSDDLSRFGFGGCIGNRCAVWKPQSDGLGASAVDASPRLLRVILIWGFLIATNGVSYISLLPDCGHVSKIEA